jgi:hypothetical protein
MMRMVGRSSTPIILHLLPDIGVGCDNFRSVLLTGPSMSDLTATELELLTFFEVIPRLLDKDEAWAYNDAAYEVRRDDQSLSFAVAPAYKDVRVIIKRGEHTLYEMNAMGIEDLKYHDDGGSETLEIVVTSQDRLFLRLKPQISVIHEVRERAMTANLFLAAAGNTLAPAYAELQKLGFSLSLVPKSNGEESWIRAERAGLRLEAPDPLQLLGLAALVNRRGASWMPTGSEIDAMLKLSERG